MRDVAGVADETAEEASESFVSLGKAVAAIGIGKLLGDALEMGDALTELSQISGLSTTKLQELAFAAREGGGTIDDVADAAREMQLRLQEAADLGSGPAVDALRLIGLEIGELPLDDANVAFELLRQRISEVEDPAQRLFIQEELLGGASERLNSLLSLTAVEMSEVRREAHELGQVMSEETVEATNAAADALERAKQGATNLAGETVLLTEKGHDFLDPLRAIGRGLAFWREEEDEVNESVQRTSERVPLARRAIEDYETAASTQAATSERLNRAIDAGALGLDAYTDALVRANREMDAANAKAATLTAHLSDIVGAIGAADLGTLGGELGDVLSTRGAVGPTRELLPRELPTGPVADEDTGRNFPGGVL